MLAAVPRRYLLHGLGGTPDVVERLLKSLALADPVWDFRPHADRFTLREIVAHLADWETVVTERTRRTLIENEPFLPNWDEEQMSIEHDYAHSDPHASLQNFRSRRAGTLALLHQVADDDWDRSAFREGVGSLTVLAQTVLVAGHDGYHTQQIAQWLEAWENFNGRSL